DPDPAVRAHAARALRPSAASEGTLVSLLASDQEAGVRQAAAEALAGHKGKEVLRALVRAVAEDADGGVRAAALDAVVHLGAKDADDMICKAMLEDPDERVRER